MPMFTVHCHFSDLFVNYMRDVILWIEAITHPEQNEMRQGVYFLLLSRNYPSINCLPIITQGVDKFTLGKHAESSPILLYLPQFAHYNTMFFHAFFSARSPNFISFWCVQGANFFRHWDVTFSSFRYNSIFERLTEYNFEGLILTFWNS